MDITQLLDRDYYNINAIIPAEELRNVCLDDETLVTTGLRHTVRSMPRLKSFSIDFGLQYEIPNVQNGSPELPKAMKHFISTFSLRLIGGHGFRAETGRRGIKSLITAWRERQQSFLLRSVVHTALSDGGMLSAVRAAPLLTLIDY